MIVLPTPHKKIVDRWEASHKISGFATFIDAHKISGFATFIDAHTIQVNGQQHQAKAFIIAVGSAPA